jgi:hypothetical protein
MMQSRFLLDWFASEFSASEPFSKFSVESLEFLEEMTMMLQSYPTTVVDGYPREAPFQS